MLLIALALQSAAIARPAVTPARPKITRAMLRRSARPPAPATASLLGACRTAEGCERRSPTTRFRLTAARDPMIDRKLEMVRAASGPSCGLIGMPVCPARGRRLLHFAY